MKITNNSGEYTINVNKCNICRSSKIRKVIDLGNHTPADTFLNKKNLKLKIPKTRLLCFYCKNCLNIQLKRIVNKEFRYNGVEYSYTSSNSKISREYWNKYYLYIKKKINKNSNNILEIGANDGYLLKKFRKKTHKLYAYEASKKMSLILKKNRINSRNEFFEDISKDSLNKKIFFFDIIICNNVLNHCHKLLIFFNNISSLLSDDGFFCLEIPYSPWMIVNKRFEIIYLEHLNYFSLTSILKLCNQSNLFINKVNFFNYHGQMMRVIISKKKSFFKENKILISEKKFFNKKNVFKNFMDSIENKKKKFILKLKNIKKKNYSVVAVGASAKTSSLINYFNLNNKNLDFVIDNSTHKIGKFIPLRRIPVKSDFFLKKLSKIYIFFSTWNIAKHLKKKLIKINRNIKIIKY
jgi:SAM-dependent methyltransferase